MPCEYCETNNCDYCNEDECPCCGSKDYFIPTRFNLQFTVKGYENGDYFNNIGKWEENLQEFMDTDEVDFFCSPDRYQIEIAEAVTIVDYNRKFSKFLSRYPELTYAYYYDVRH